MSNKIEIRETPNEDLTLKAFDNQLQPSKQLHPDLLQPPFTLMMVGPKGSSKTTTILRLIYGNNKKKNCTNCYHKFYRHYFDKIYVFSHTWSNDAKTAVARYPTTRYTRMWKTTKKSYRRYWMGKRRTSARMAKTKLIPSC